MERQAVRKGVNAGEDNYEAWSKFRESFADFAVIEELYKQPPLTQVAMLRSCFGREQQNAPKKYESRASGKQ